MLVLDSVGDEVEVEPPEGLEVRGDACGDGHPGIGQHERVVGAGDARRHPGLEIVRADLERLARPGEGEGPRGGAGRCARESDEEGDGSRSGDHLPQKNMASGRREGCHRATTPPAQAPE